MAKRRSVVAGWDPDFNNPNGTTGRPKGVQTVSDMRAAVTFDILGNGIIAKHGVPTITGGPTNTVTITPFMAAILSTKGGYYTPSITSNEIVEINLTNTGAVKIFVQQKDYEVDPAAVDSEVVLGVVYGATAIPAGALLLFTSTLSGQTSTSGMTFTPAFKYTGAASGVVRVPTQADLANVTLIQTGTRALVTSGANMGEYFYTGSVWEQSSLANPKLSSALTKYFETNGDLKASVLKDSNIDWDSLGNIFTSTDTPTSGIGSGGANVLSLTATVKGTYLIIGSYQVSGNGANLNTIMTLRKNGTTITGTSRNVNQAQAGNTWGVESGSSSFVSLDVGDTVSMFVGNTPSRPVENRSLSMIRVG